MGLNPYREIVFRSTSQIAGARTVNRLFSPFSDVRKKKGLRIFRRLFHADAQNWFFVVLLRGLLWLRRIFSFVMLELQSFQIVLGPYNLPESQLLKLFHGSFEGSSAGAGSPAYLQTAGNSEPVHDLRHCHAQQ